MKHDAIHAIRGSTFFQGLSTYASRELAQLSRKEQFRKRDIIFSENTKGERIYLLSEGSVQLQKTTMDGNEIVIKTVKLNDVFAEVILFEQDRYPVTAISIAPSTVYSFNKNDIMELLEYPEFRGDFIRSLMQKMRYLAERVRYLSLYDVEQRFFMFLKEHYGELASISPKISKKDMAAAIGSTPETFSRLIKRLQNEGSITWNDKVIDVSEEIWSKF